MSKLGQNPQFLSVYWKSIAKVRDLEEKQTTFSEGTLKKIRDALSEKYQIKFVEKEKEDEDSFLDDELGLCKEIIRMIPEIKSGVLEFLLEFQKFIEVTYFLLRMN